MGMGGESIVDSGDKDGCVEGSMMRVNSPFAVVICRAAFPVCPFITVGDSGLPVPKVFRGQELNLSLQIGWLQ